MESRGKILNAIAAAQHEFVAHPAINHHLFRGNEITNFEQKLKFFDGTSLRFVNRQAAIEWLKTNIKKENHVVYSSLGDYAGNINLDELDDPHKAICIETCISEGVLGVGETGSVYVTNKSLGLAAAALFSTDLFLLLDAEKIVDGIQTAYKHLDLRANQYGAFYSGPSATADIEAVHITGAQSEISLTVLLYNCKQ